MTGNSFVIENYWHRVLWELENRDNPDCFFAFIEPEQERDMKCQDPFYPDEDTHSQIQAKRSKTVSSRPAKNTRYYLGKRFGHAYITAREADCVAELIQGKTARDIGEALGLSKRSVEYYIDNARTRLDCSNRKTLIALIKQSEFERNYFGSGSSKE